MLAQDHTTHLCEHEDDDTGKLAFYLLRWVNTHDDAGL